jgi:ABC superfamily ATP binding cassette transporter permease
MYNEVAQFLDRDKVNLADDEYFLVGVSGKIEPVLKEMVRDKLSEYDIKRQKGADKRIIAMSGYFTSVAVVSDSKYQDISKDLVKEKIYAFSQDDLKAGGSQKYEELKKAIGFEMGKESLVSYFSYYDSENLTRKLVSYVGSILCISFLIGIASIIYSRLYSSIEEESRKYSIMMKIGLSREELKDVLSSTLRWVFVLPFTVALGISWIIILFIEQNTVASYSGLAVICSCIYLAVEFIMYIMIKKRYQKKIFDNIYEI